MRSPALRAARTAILSIGCIDQDDNEQLENYDSIANLLLKSPVF